MSKNVAASVRARLLVIAKEEGSDFNQVLVRYALERFLYRLSRSEFANSFLLKGAMLFNLWYGMPHRATRDIDLLGFGDSKLETIAETFREIAAIVVDDGIVFDPDNVQVDEIRKGAGYNGARVLLLGDIAGARCKTQIDIGYGDAVTPAPVSATYPVMLDEFPAPILQTYPVYTVIAEKLHAIHLLGMTNSRLKDYLDIYVLLDKEQLDKRILADAIAATFERRGDKLIAEVPIGLTDEFGMDTSRQAMWLSLLKKNEIAPVPLIDVVTLIRNGLMPCIHIQAHLLHSIDTQELRSLESTLGEWHSTADRAAYDEP